MSAERNLMKKCIFLLLTAVLVFTLTACADSPDRSSPPDPEAELALCRSALEDFQAQSSYQIHKSCQYDSYYILNSSSESDYWKHGEDWMHVNRPLPDDPSEGIFAYIGKDGRIFSTERGAWSSWERINWSAHDEWPWHEAPWLETFCWEENEIAYASTAMLDNQKVITVLVTTPWVASEEDPDLGVADEYQLAFHLNTKGSLEQVVVDVTFKDERGAKVTTEHSVHSVVTTEEAKIAAKINREFGRALEQEAKLNAPQPLPTGSFVSNDGTVEFIWNLPETELALVPIPTVLAKAHMMDGKDAKKIAETLLPGAKFRDLGDRPAENLSRAQIQKKIEILEQYNSEEALTKLWGNHEDADAHISSLRSSLAVYRDLLRSAPEESTLAPCDWELKSADSGHYGFQYADALMATTEVDGIPYTLHLRVSQREGENVLNAITLSLGDGDNVSATPAMHDRSRLCTSPEPTQEQYAAALTKAQNLLDEMGMGHYQVVTKGTYVDPGYFNDQERYEIYVEAVPVMEGIPALYDYKGQTYLGEEYYVSPYLPTVVHFSFSPNGDLINFNLINPVEQDKLNDPSADPLRLEELLERAKQRLQCYSAENLDRFTGNLLMTGANVKNLDCQVHITGIQYGLVQKDWGKPGELIFRPALLFRGTVDYFDKTTGEHITGSASPYSAREQTILTMDALWGDEMGE